MRPEQRVVVSIPLTELWDARGPAGSTRGRRPARSRRFFRRERASRPPLIREPQHGRVDAGAGSCTSFPPSASNPSSFIRLHPVQTTARLALLLIALSTCPPALAAQPRGEARTTVSARSRMNAFLATVRSFDDDSVASYFPAEGDWTLVHVVHRPSGDDVGIRRFRGPEAAAAMALCGPLWNAFRFSPEGVTVGSLRLWAEESIAWRATGPARFAPAGRPAFMHRDGSFVSSAFVEWRRERGRWVIAALGHETFEGRRVLGTTLDDVTRTRRVRLPISPAYAGIEDWFLNNGLITFKGRRYIKYGLPRSAIEPNLLQPVGWHGAVRVYAETGFAEMPGTLLIPASPGTYQMYNQAGDGCP